MVLNNVVAFLLFLGQVVIVVGVGCLAYFGKYSNSWLDLYIRDHPKIGTILIRSLQQFRTF